MEEAAWCRGTEGGGGAGGSRLDEGVGGRGRPFLFSILRAQRPLSHTHSVILPLPEFRSAGHERFLLNGANFESPCCIRVVVFVRQATDGRFGVCLSGVTVKRRDARSERFNETRANEGASARQVGEVSS